MLLSPGVKLMTDPPLTPLFTSGRHHLLPAGFFCLFVLRWWLYAFERKHSKMYFCVCMYVYTHTYVCVCVYAHLYPYDKFCTFKGSVLFLISTSKMTEWNVMTVELTIQVQPYDPWTWYCSATSWSLLLRCWLQTTLPAQDSSTHILYSFLGRKNWRYVIPFNLQCLDKMEPFMAKWCMPLFYHWSIDIPWSRREHYRHRQEVEQGQG